MNSLEDISVLGGLPSADAANTSAASGAWINVKEVIGDIRTIVDVGVVTAGSIAPTIEDAADISGTDNAEVVPRDGAFTEITTSNDPARQERHIDSNSIRGFIRFVGTITTGPVQVAVTFEGRLKNSA
jgi:hypothetical protein